MCSFYLKLCQRPNSYANDGLVVLKALKKFSRQTLAQIAMQSPKQCEISGQS